MVNQPRAAGRQGLRGRLARLRWWLLAGGLLTALTLLAVRFGPAASLTLGLAAPWSEPWLSFASAAPSREEIAIAAGGAALLADLHRPAAPPRGAIVLVHGLSRSGRRQPDLERLARQLARHRQLVLVPHFEGLAAFRLGGREVEEVLQAAVHLRARSPGIPLGVAGFSFGAGPALLAAARLPELELVGAFGGYADLRHVVRFITTGVHDFQGRRYVHPQEEYNRWKLLALLVGFVEDAGDRERLAAIADRKLADPSDDTGALERALGPTGTAIRALVLNRREDAVDDLVAALPAPARQALEALSPLGAIPRLRARLVLAHGTSDDSIPFTESQRLAAAAPGPVRLALLEGFHHTGPRTFAGALGALTGDAWRLMGIADDLLTMGR